MNNWFLSAIITYLVLGLYIGYGIIRYGGHTPMTGRQLGTAVGFMIVSIVLFFIGVLQL